MWNFEYNYTLTTAIIAWSAAQIIKTILFFIMHKKFNAERLFGAGGMPSSHSALVCSATVAISRVEGVGSPLFAVMFIIAVVVMYDAMGVRRAAGQHAKAINQMNKFLLDEVVDEDEEKPEIKKLKEYLGHTPYEVLGGALLGILIALIVPVK